MDNDSYAENKARLLSYLRCNIKVGKHFDITPLKYIEIDKIFAETGNVCLVSHDIRTSLLLFQAVAAKAARLFGTGNVTANMATYSIVTPTARYKLLHTMTPADMVKPYRFDAVFRIWED